MVTYRITAGTVEGLPVETPNGPAVAVLGVPVAAVTRRFAAAEPATPWKGIRASALGARAWQRNDPHDPDAGRPRDERDCLNANIWIPAEPASTPRPVLVWVHGGAHVFGSNAHPLCDGARFAAAHGVIVVALNYRLGAFGYLRLEHLLGADYADADNLALTDILAGLEWIRHDIVAFGGDPTAVTLMGQSAGGVAVATLLAESAAGAPFQRVIVQSATAERVHTRDEAAGVTDELLRALPGGSTDPEQLIDIPPQTLVDAQAGVIEKHARLSRGPSVPFRPIVDGRVVRDTPLRSIAAGGGVGIDAIFGTNLNEASAYVDLGGMTDEEARRALRDEIAERRETFTPDEYVEAWASRGVTEAGAAGALEAYLTDVLYRQPMQRMLDARVVAAARAPGPAEPVASRRGSTRSYLFEWARSVGETWARGAGHSLELPFVFGHVDDTAWARAELGEHAPVELASSMGSAWSSFARTGDPAAISVPAADVPATDRPADTGPADLVWPEYVAARDTLLFGERVRVVRDPLAEERRLFVR